MKWSGVTGPEAQTRLGMEATQQCRARPTLNQTVQVGPTPFGPAEADEEGPFGRL